MIKSREATVAQEKDLSRLATRLVNTLDDLKALDIVCIPVTQLTTIADIMIVCTAITARHAMALTNNIIIVLKKAGINVRSEGENQGEWVLIDGGDIIVHIMQAKTRAFYDLEGLWQHDEK